MSDLHFDKHADRGQSFIESLQSDGVDAVIIAGDMGEQADIDFPLELFCNKFKEVIRIQGNHEFYSSTKEEVEENERIRKESYSNYHSLENDILELNGKRFLGSTLWFNYMPEEMYRDWSDFHHITGLANWVFDANRKSRKFLQKNLREGDIVITHHMPAEVCINKIYKGCDTNHFFLCDMEWLIEERKPALWIHGHTHRSVDVELYDTRIICNPFGYLGYENNTGFIDDLIIEA